ncbi:hypothetical protein ACGFYV_23810, partial [Streptomyces sp. NPDC048297]
GVGKSAATGGADWSPAVGGAGKSSAVGGAGESHAAGGAGKSAATGGADWSPAVGGAGKSSAAGGAGKSPTAGGAGEPGTAGEGATVQALLSFDDGERRWGTVGVGPHATAAALEALLDAVTYVLTGGSGQGPGHDTRNLVAAPVG